MTRYHATANGPVPFTPEEEAERDAEEAASAAFASKRAKEAILREIERLEGAPNYINRGSRELEIVSMQDIATRKAEKFKADNPADERAVEQLAAEYLAATPYYGKLIALDSQIDALRVQLRALG